MLELHCCTQAFSSVVSRAHTLVAVRGLLIAVASLVMEHRLKSTGSAVVVGLSCPEACGIFPDQGLSLCLLCYKVDS